MSDYEADAKALLKESRPANFGYSGTLDIGKTWAMTIARTRDSSLLEESNFDVIWEDMHKRFPTTTKIERFGHWAVGWIERIMVKVVDKKGSVTPSGKAILDWMAALENYPVASDDDFSRREYEDTIENIKNEGGLDDDQASEVYSWLSDHDQGAVESRDGHGGYPTSKQIDKALRALGTVPESEIDDLIDYLKDEDKRGAFTYDEIVDIANWFAVNEPKRVLSEDGFDVKEMRMALEMAKSGKSHAPHKRQMSLFKNKGK